MGSIRDYDRDYKRDCCRGYVGIITGLLWRICRGFIGCIYICRLYRGPLPPLFSNCGQCHLSSRQVRQHAERLQGRGDSRFWLLAQRS